MGLGGEHALLPDACAAVVGADNHLAGDGTDTGSTVSSLTPTMYWNGVSGASDYGLYISQYPYGSSNIIYSNSSLSGTSTNFVLPSGTLSNGVKYCWNMNTENGSADVGLGGEHALLPDARAAVVGADNHLAGDEHGHGVHGEQSDADDVLERGEWGQ